MTDDAPTRWSRIEGRDYEYLVARFWQPVQRFLATRLPGPQEAEDLTQELFLSFVQRDLLGRADPARGSFRSLLFHCARQFLIDHYRARGAARRDAAREQPLGEAELGLAAGDPTPQQAFDREWYLALVNQARREVKAHYAAEGKEPVYRAFRLYYFGDAGPEPWSQARIAEELGLPVTQVNNYLHRARQLFAQRLRAAVGQYAGTPEETEQELACLRELAGGRTIEGEPSSTLFGN